MNKKGQMDMSFSLVFVTIVGIIVFSFFMFFLVKYIDLQEHKESVEISRSMDSIITGLKTQTQQKELGVNYNFNMDVYCDGIIINDQEPAQEIDPIFFASSGSNDDLLIWTQELSKGFSIDNLLYLIDLNKKYYSDNPTFFDRVNVSGGSISNYDVGVFFNFCPAENSDKTICFSDSTVRGRPYVLFDDSLIYGAAFSDLEQFDCSYSKIIPKWINLFEIYISKNLAMNDCSSIRFSLNEELVTLRNKLISGEYSIDVHTMNELNYRLSDGGCGVLY